MHVNHLDVGGFNLQSSRAVQQSLAEVAKEQVGIGEIAVQRAQQGFVNGLVPQALLIQSDGLPQVEPIGRPSASFQSVIALVLQEARWVPISGRRCCLI